MTQFWRAADLAGGGDFALLSRAPAISFIFSVRKT
jgi:hypothetical protein